MSTDEITISSLEELASATEVEEEKIISVMDPKTKAMIARSLSKKDNKTWEPLPECPLEEMGFAADKDDIEFEFGCKKGFMINGLSHLLENKICTDVLVHVGNKAFPCHMALLQSCTGYFKKLTDIYEVSLGTDHVTQKGFELAYEWMVNAKAQPQRQHIIELYLTAKNLEMPELLDHIWSRLNNPKLLNGLEAYKLYLECLSLDVPVLQELMLERIGNYFLFAVATKEYLELEPKHVLELISNRNMCVNSEMEMFMCAVRWLFYNWCDRKEFAVSIMQAIQFGAMPSWYTTVLKSKQTDKEFQELLDLPEIKSMINMGLSFSVTNNFLEPRSPLYEPLHMQKHLRERQWIFCRDVPHHHRYECPHWRFLDVDAFNEFMEHIIRAAYRFVPSLEYVKSGQLMSCCHEALQKKALN
ncbi:ectoderm-neural cortex protein 1-like [Drosophila ficusphila]|uniref:ectoderm-neural cortex protein 1-like n=1 Tax=Drosophila ficusphila TaxID=30025 RepID=UPI0007E6092F|nr:ectoderm-neural cortex protein 1-like [Drosophila ficusphila]